jgi:hypothetical protein
MEKMAGRILKAEEVKLQGQYHLDIAQASQNPAAGSKIVSGISQVQIVENSDDYAVMKITCSCGTKTHVRCEYSDTKTK